MPTETYFSFMRKNRIGTYSIIFIENDITSACTVPAYRTEIYLCGLSIIFITNGIKYYL